MPSKSSLSQEKISEIVEEIHECVDDVYDRIEELVDCIKRMETSVEEARAMFEWLDDSGREPSEKRS